MPDTDFRTEEKKFYNAVAILSAGELFSLHKISKQYSDWRSAWGKLNNGKINPEQEWEKLSLAGVKLFWPEELPAELSEISAPPLALYIKGDIPSEAKKVSVVGTRRATVQAKEFTKKFTQELTQSGVAVVSGLAMGIDTAAHEGALLGKGKTIAVLANSLDSVYPRQNAGLAERILVQNGALISEYPFGSSTFQHRFLERNRIVAGFSAGTVVIEAPLDSGSLVTANLALEANREVFVVPGPASHPNYVGSHKLIRSGARLAVSAKEVLEDLNWAADENLEVGRLLPDPSLSGLDKKIFDALRESTAALDVDRIQELTQINVSDLNRHLTILQIKGLVKEQNGRYYLN